MNTIWNEKNKIFNDLNQLHGVCVYIDEEYLSTFCTNFGGMYSTPPLAVICVKRLDSITDIIHYCNINEIPINIRGVGHSFGTQSLSKGIVLVVSVEKPVFEQVDERKFKVSAFETWLSIEYFLRKKGLSFPILTRHPDTTVGGTLTVGGYGEDSYLYGSQASCIQSYTLLTPDGKKHHCSENSNSELYNFGLVSLGILGIIEDVTFEAIPLRLKNILYVIEFDGILHLLIFLILISEYSNLNIEAMTCQLYQGRYYVNMILSNDSEQINIINKVLEYEVVGCICYKYHLVSDYRGRTFGTYRDDLWNRDNVNLWGDYCVDQNNVISFADFLLNKVINNDVFIKNKGRLLIILKKSPDLSKFFPFEPISKDMSGIVFGFGVYFTIPKNVTKEYEKIKQLHREILEMCILNGGRPYLAGWHEMSYEDKLKTYGLDYIKILDLKNKLDPKGIVNNYDFFTEH
ncbi:FAD-binding oxidoreductase [Vibrio spartinae]|uniref:Putative oxidoreductase ORF5 in fasciation locus n=1 Tax=Vibrio spartinae TaxID=1918945 RepID=A0A1N6M8H6_9VIBR|nr:FAD-binding protein [Vibrio spartinae]SIO95742.1 putative oxidoreductase ORF5 in fasciation locus [Vibrio spartinae]